MPEPISFLQHKLTRTTERIEKAAKLTGLINAAHVAATMGETEREQDCLRQAQKLYEELNASTH